MSSNLSMKEYMRGTMTISRGNHTSPPALSTKGLVRSAQWKSASERAIDLKSKGRNIFRISHESWTHLNESGSSVSS